MKLKSAQQLIKKLKKDHQIVAQLIHKIKTQGLGHPSSEKDLLLLEEALITHLETEDQIIYPFLMKNAKKSDIPRKIVKRCTIRLGKISIEAGHFFDLFHKQSKKGLLGQCKKTHKKFDTLTKLLAERITKEETEVFNLFLQLHLFSLKKT
ncbi:hypothetical protein ACQZV8_08465 [Magnetococcales bacterium HHB-1]